MSWQVTILLSLLGMFLLLVFFSYFQETFFKTVKHTIKKGRHYSLPLLPFFYNWNITRLSTTVKFHDNCLYDEHDLSYSGVNKLTGITYGFVHEDSYRWGWRCVNGKIDLYAYVYDQGIRQYKKITTLVTDKTYDLTIIRWIDKVQYILNDKVIYEDNTIDITGDSILTYINRPYFGGKSKAPHTMDIDIEYDYA